MEYLVAKKGVHVKIGKGKVLVDLRMKKDARKSGMGKIGKRGNMLEGKGFSKDCAKKGRK